MSGARELNAAGIVEPRLRAAYSECRMLNAEHGRTYFLATWLLPAARRPAVHALYGFARYADEIVDGFEGTPVAKRATWLDELCDDLRAAHAQLPVVMALRDTMERYAIPAGLIEDFVASMRMDLTVTDYATFEDLMGYVHGSAAVIGEQMLPVLGTAPGMRDVARPYARDLGTAFQLANFIRDVGEDIGRGRVYLPAEEVAAFGVTREQLASGVVDGRVRRLLAFQIARAREIFRAAEPGIRLLEPGSRDCIKTAFTLYGGILDAVEAADYQVLDRRVAVNGVRRAAVASAGLARAMRARRSG